MSTWPGGKGAAAGSEACDGDVYGKVNREVAESGARGPEAPEGGADGREGEERAAGSGARGLAAPKGGAAEPEDEGKEIRENEDDKDEVGECMRYGVDEGSRRRTRPA